MTKEKFSIIRMWCVINPRKEWKTICLNYDCNSLFIPSAGIPSMRLLAMANSMDQEMRNGWISSDDGKAPLALFNYI